MKRIFLIFFFIYSYTTLALVELDLDKMLFEAFGSKLSIGIKSMKGNNIYIKITEGKVQLNANKYSEELPCGSIIKLTKVSGKIKYNGKLYDELILQKEYVVTLTALSKDSKTYRNFRGDIKFIIEDNQIIPVNIVTAEEYLYSVVPSEIGVKFPDEAIKAQALAARTYLYYGLQTRKYDNYDLMDDTSSQMYLGYDKEFPRINQLINETSGEVIVYNNELINALYHSASGGMTSNNEDVWKGTPVPYLRAVDDKDYWKKSPRAKWTYRISKKNLSRIMGYDVRYIKIVSKKNGRVLKVKIGGSRYKYVTGNNLRKLLGYTNIFSTMLRIRDTGSYFVFDGNGSGHGVGLSQWGAYGMAERGFTYKDIVKHYYKGVEENCIINCTKK